MSGALEKIGKLAQGRQYIQRKCSPDADCLPYSAKFDWAGIEWILQSDSSMLIGGDWYAAKVRIPVTGELEKAKDFVKARDILLRNLTIVSVVRDKQLDEYRVAEKNLKVQIQALEKGTVREDLAGVRQCAERYLYNITKDCAKRVGEDPSISATLKSAIRDYADKHELLQQRNSLMRSKKGFNYDCVPFVSFLCESIYQGCKAYRKRLLEDCPFLLQRHVGMANDSVMLNVAQSDLELISRLQKLMNESKFGQVLPIITTKYWTAVKGLKKWTPVISSVYFYLLRSLLQAAEDISSTLNGLEVIVYENEWKLRSLPEGQPFQVRICMQQLKLLVDLTNHYEPGKSSMTEKFPYEVKQLPSIESTNELYCLLQETVEVSKTVRIDVEGLFAMLRKFPTKEFQDSTDNAVRFILALLPTMANLVEKDAVILQKQLNNSNPSLLDTFTMYWRQRQAFYTNLVSRLPGNYWKSKAHEVVEMFLQIAMNLMDGMAAADSGQFLRVLDGILIILSELRFDWYVSRAPDDVFVTKGLVSSCDSETSDGARGHLVLQPDKFVEQYCLRCPDLAIPRHYEVMRLKSLLSTVQTLTGQRTWTKKRILDNTVLLVTTIRKLLFNLHRADCSVGKLYSISTEPLQSAVEDFVANPNTTFDDFKIELKRLGESYYCIPVIPENPSDEMGCFDRLRNYYATEIEKYAREEVDDARTGSGFVGVLNWNLPNLTRELACIPTVWYRMASKGCVNLCKYPSPTAGQFCSVLKLVNFGTHEGCKVPIHLMGLLPDQKKALVLGLSSAVLAYRGYQVYIAYPDRYLLDRNANKFKELVRTANFRTYDEMMMQCFKPLLVKAESYMRKCMGIESNDTVDRTGIDLDNSVLFIDEVGAYLSEKFTNFPMNMQIIIPGLDLVQKEIWSIVTSGDSEKESITHKIDSFVFRNCKQKFHVLRDLLGKQVKYEVYDYFSGKTSLTNAELYYNHLAHMIDAAIHLHYSVLLAKLFRLNSSGLITALTEYELSSWHTSLYFKTFAYFKLKQSDFIQEVSGGYNYGYLCIPIGTLSYGYLLRNFKLVLGVTDVAIDSSDQQQISMKNLYNVEAKFPSISADICQSAELKFEPGQNFTCSPTESAWRKDIFSRLQVIIHQNRSAIVFFDNDYQLEEFRQEYGPQLERLNILTTDTDRETINRCLDDAGLPWMTTLATWDMVRGMDYKSSVTVEDNGGIHIIQCFFSLDSREEMRIQNRTASKPNRGTYELVVCVDHLEELTLMGGGETVADGITYDQLNEGRKRLMEQMQASWIDKMKEANRKHIEIVEFYRKH